MLMKIRRASDITTEAPPVIEVMEIKTIEDVIALSEKYQANIILLAFEILLQARQSFWFWENNNTFGNEKSQDSKYLHYLPF